MPLLCILLTNTLCNLDSMTELQAPCCTLMIFDTRHFQKLVWTIDRIISYLLYEGVYSIRSQSQKQDVALPVYMY